MLEYELLRAFSFALLCTKQSNKCSKQHSLKIAQMNTNVIFKEREDLVKNWIKNMLILPTKLLGISWPWVSTTVHHNGVQCRVQNWFRIHTYNFFLCSFLKSFLTLKDINKPLIPVKFQTEGNMTDLIWISDNGVWRFLRGETFRYFSCWLLH